jgi:hypothetical protein
MRAKIVKLKPSRLDASTFNRLACALSATDSVPWQSVCSSNVGSSKVIGEDVGDEDGKNAKVRRNGVCRRERGTGARSVGSCCRNALREIHWGSFGIHTVITSSPITSTSGLRKCFNATMPARHAQSAVFSSPSRTVTI